MTPEKILEEYWKEIELAIEEDRIDDAEELFEEAIQKARRRAFDEVLDLFDAHETYDFVAGKLFPSEENLVDKGVLQNTALIKMKLEQLKKEGGG